MHINVHDDNTGANKVRAWVGAWHGRRSRRVVVQPDGETGLGVRAVWGDQPRRRHAAPLWLVVSPPPPPPPPLPSS